MTDKIDFESLIAKEGSANWDRSPPATPAQVAKLQASLPFALPREYVEFLLFSNGAYGEIPVQPYWCIMFRAQEILQENIDYEVSDHLPGYLAFASSGGGELLAFKTNEEPWPVYTFHFPYSSSEDAMLVAADFLELVCMLGKKSAEDDEDPVE